MLRSLNKLKTALSLRSLRTRMTLYILAALLPIILFQVYLIRHTALELERQASQTAVQYARLVAQTHAQTLQESRQVFTILAYDIERLAHETSRCGRQLGDLLDVTEGFDIFLLLDGQGKMICGSRQFEEPIDFSDRLYFQRARATGGFAIGEYIIGRVSGEAVLPMGYPVLDDAGKLQHMLVGGRQLHQITAVLRGHALPEQATVRILDGDGSLLAEHPDRSGRIGEMLGHARLRAGVLSRRTGSFETGAGDGRLVTGFVPLGQRFGEAFALVTIPRHVLLADVDQAVLLTVFGFIVLVLATVAMNWIGFRREVFKPLSETVAWLKAFPGEASETRLPVGRRSEEMRSLALSINVMASAVQNYTRLLESQRDELQNTNIQLERLATFDALTGALSRYAVRQIIASDMERARRHERALSVLLLDIDHFKAINDHDGHAAGDAVLTALAQTMQEALRVSDTFGRWGGEEFLVVLPETDKAHAGETAERLRQDTERMEVIHDHEKIRITVSIGVAEYGPDGDTWEALYRSVDRALYRAKQSGRNQVSD